MKLLRENGLTIVLLILFAASIVGQWLAGWHVAVDDALKHGQPAISLGQYATSPQFLATVFENWESEFLQMSAYVILTAVLFQRGSAESKDPYAPPPDKDLLRQSRDPGSPSVLRWGPF